MKVYIEIELFKRKEYGSACMNDCHEEIEGRIKNLLTKFARKRLIGIKKLDFNYQEDGK